MKQQKNFINYIRKLKKKLMIKPKTIYEIHALIGRCHLHTKKKSTYSITLKMGAKAVANTQYKIPTNDEVNFNTQLILKIDKTLFDGPGKLSIIVTMLSQQKQKKIIGSVFANYKLKGLQNYKIAQCACKDKQFEVSVEFEVVNLQNLNNNQNNNKFHSPNHSEMKDLKKALTVSRQKQLVKTSRAKQGSAVKAPAEKTQAKLNKQKIQKQLKDQMSPDLSSLTTKIVVGSAKLNQQAKQYVSELKDKIVELQLKTKQYSNKQKTQRKQLSHLQNQIEIIKNENECLLEILKFQQEKSSAAISYILHLTQKIGQKQLLSNNNGQYLQLIQTIKQNQKSDASHAIKQHKKAMRSVRDYSFDFKPIQEKQEFSQNDEHQIQTNLESQRLINQMQGYKVSIQQLRQKIIDLQAQQVQKSQSINYLEIQISKGNKQNEFLKEEIKKLRKIEGDNQLEIKSIQILNKSLDGKIQELQNQIVLSKDEYRQIINQREQLQKVHKKKLIQNKQLKDKILDLQKKISSLKNYQTKYDQIFQENLKLNKKINQKLSIQIPKTPLESEIIAHKSREEDGGDTNQIQNIIEQLNGCINYQKQPELLLTSRRVQSNQHFLTRNKSESLLKDLQADPESDDPNTNETSKDIYKATYNSSNGESKSQKKIEIPQPQKQVQKYNYEYDIDSLNYFNNFEEDHERMSESGVEDNTGEIQVQVGNKA